MPRRFDLWCAGCGVGMNRVAKSLPQGQARCRACRRLAREAVPTPAAAQGYRICGGCKGYFAPRVNSQRFCSQECRAVVLGSQPRKARHSTKTSTAARGYGAAHQRERKRWQRLVDAGQATCWRCGGAIHAGSPWDLGHDDHDRSLYRGPEHRSCNRSAGARKSHEKRTQTHGSSVRW